MDKEKTIVLLIEDSPGDARLIQEYLSESGSDIFRLEHVDRLSLGLEHLARGDIGVILLDLTLPDSQGLEGLLKILAKAPDVPVVVLSGIKDEAIAIKAVHEGAQDYLVKGSIDGTLLVRLLRHAIERHYLRVALKESESRYRLLADNIADVIWVADEKGWITYVSPSVEGLLGYTVDEVEKLKIRDLLTLDSAEQARRLIKNQMEVGVQQSRSTPFSLTLEHIRKDGSTVWAEVMLSFLLDKKGHFSGIMGSTRDITARKRAEEALQQSEEHFRSLIENASDAILIINGDGVLQYESPSIQRLLGYRFEERVGKSVFENIHPDDRQSVIDAFVQLVQEVGRITQMAMRVRHKNGSWRIIDVTAKNLLDNPAVDGIVANFRDVTERKEAEKALRISEEKLRRYWDSSPDAIYVHDLEGTFLAGNKAAERMTGYSREEIEGKNLFVFNLLPPEYLDKASRLLQLSAAGMPTGPDEFEMIRKDGSRIFVEVSAYPIIQEGRTEVIGIARDISERKRMEEALRESETRFRTVFEGTGVAIALVDRRGKPLGVNPAFSQMFGYSFEEFSKVNNQKYLHPDDAMVDAGLYMEMLNGKRDHYTIDKRYIRKDGGVLWGRQNLSVVRDVEGKPEYFIAMIENITERRKMEEEVRRLSDAVKMSTDSIVLTDLEGRLVEVNEATLKIQGVKSKEELIGSRPSDYIVSEDSEKAFADMVALMEKGCVNEVEYHVMTRDGRKILLETSASLIKGKNGVSTGIVAVSRDITERKRMEEVLRKSEEQFRALVENALDAIVVVNGEGVITYASPSNDRMLGYPLSQIIGKDGFSLAHPEDMPDVIAAYTRLIEEPGKPVSVEARLRHNDGSWRTVEAVAQNLVENDSVKGIVVNWRDVTERKKAEDALRESESRHRLYFESVTDVIYSLDKDFRFESISPSVENVLGYKPEEVVGKRFDEIKLLVPETVKQAFVDVMRALAGERIVTYGKFVRKDGGIVYGEVSLTPIFAPDGSVKGALGVARDVTERKLMENALKGSERAYRLLFDSIIDGLIVIDAETLKVVLANRQVPRIFGFNSVEETIKADPMDYIHPEDRERVLKIIVEDMFRKDLRQVSEFRVRARDGRELWISVLGTRTEYGGRTAGLVSIRDITDRKRVEETARETEERFRRLVNNAQDIVFRWSIDKGLEYVSPVALSITGYSAEELMSNPMVGMELAREGDPIITADYRRVIAGGLSLRSREISFIRKDGKRIYLDMLSQSIRDSEEKIIAFEGILRDITERKEMERALQQREQDYLLLLESTHEGMIVIDAGTLKVLFGNRRASLMFDFDPEVQEGIGVDLLDFVHPDDREVVIHGFNDDLPKLEHRKRFEVRAKTKHGREIIVSALATRVEFQARLAVLLSLKDITEQRRLEEERQKMEEQLQLAGRLAAVGELAAGVAHELNNPIAAVQGYAQLLTAKRDIDESVKKDLDIIYREAQRAGKITKNLLSFARMHEPEKRFISINEALEKTLELSAHQMKINNIELEVALAPDLPRTMADFHQMQQVFVNIINNAEQAMLESHGKGKLVVRTRKYGDMIQITFTDDGPGIAEENLKRIFDPFFTTKEVGKGTGLGLSICYGLIEAHNGRIYARSKLGEGATFIVEMPIVPEEQSAAEAVFIKTKRGSARWRK